MELCGGDMGVRGTLRWRSGVGWEGIWGKMSPVWWIWGVNMG